MSKKQDKILCCVLDRYEKQKAVLKFDLDKNSSQELILAKRYLPTGFKKGDILHVNFLTEDENKLERSELAYKILEEILRGDENDRKK